MDPAFRAEDDDNGDNARVKKGKKIMADDGWSLDEVARRVPKRFTGADMYALCADAWMRAAKRTLSGASSSSSDGGSSDAAAAAVVVVRGVDFADALSELTPSLTDQDVAHYLRLRESFEGGRK